jgi:hypothetical protein
VPLEQFRSVDALADVSEPELERRAYDASAASRTAASTRSASGR